MKLVLVRGAKGVKKAGFDGPEPLRPLSASGIAQARVLTRRLAGQRVDRIVSSPALRCRQTVAALAETLGLPVEVRAELGRGESSTRASAFLRSLDAESVLCCTHGELAAKLAVKLQDAGTSVQLEAVDASEVEAAPQHRRLAVLDMGSTSFHMLVADVSPSGHLRPHSRERIMLRLGSSIARRGHVPDDEIVRTLETVKAMRKHAQYVGAEELIAVGTAALRDADNGPDLTRRIAETLKVPVRLLSGEEEARLIFDAFRRRVLLPQGPALGVDLGGGSLELAVGDDHALLFEETLRVGVTRLHGELVHRDPMRKREAKAIREHVRGQVEPLAERIRALAPSACIAAGGTARAFGDLALGLRGPDPSPTMNAVRLRLGELRSITHRLVASSHVERLDMPGMRSRRADLLPTGGLILVTIAEVLGLDGYTVCDWGLREGVLLEAAAQWWAEIEARG